MEAGQVEHEQSDDEDDEDGCTGQKDDGEETRLVGGLLFDLQLHVTLDAGGKPDRCVALESRSQFAHYEFAVR